MLKNSLNFGFRSSSHSDLAIDISLIEAIVRSAGRRRRIPSPETTEQAAY